MGTRYLKQVPWSPQQTIPDHRLYFPYSSKNSSAEHIHTLSTWLIITNTLTNLHRQTHTHTHSRRQTHTLTHIDKHTHLQTHTHTHSSAKLIVALLACLTITNKLTHIDKQHTHTHSHNTHTHTHTHTHWRTHIHAHRDMHKKAWICSADEFLELYGKVEAVVRNCLLRWSELLFEVPSTHLFDQYFFFKHITLFYAPTGAFFRWFPPFFTTPKILCAEVG